MQEGEILQGFIEEILCFGRRSEYVMDNSKDVTVNAAVDIFKG